ncbi:BTAD domain-containing putative transcriptional regulator [Nonomuraea sp. NPDC050536]|uniref:BTAD domain-containing putative transcriptional regulator n=1 Tax=Nonomuraea sp. NPDC050536 TaxID=3364366 RepID=UPI0037CB6B15
MRFGVLGSVELWRGDTRVEVGTPRNRAVLARLLLSRGKVIPLDRLIDDLWQGEAPPQALSSLRTFVCQLRRVLEPRTEGRTAPSVLVTEPGGYVLRVGDDEVDSGRFERLFRQAAEARDPALALRLLDQALGLWRGPAYVEFAGTLWAEGEIARLEELRMAAVEHRLDALLSLGRHAEAVPELDVHARAHPMREEGWRLLALGLYRSARQGDALAALRQARGYLAEELGVDPGPGLRRLEADILSQTASLELPQARPMEEPQALVRCLGRDELLAVTGAALAGAEAGSGGSVVFEGAPGSGRTQLLRAAEALAQVRGFRVAHTRTHPLEQDIPYGVARQVFEPILCALPEAERNQVLSGVAAPAAAAVWDNAVAGPGATHALYWLAVRLAERAPLLIAVDDLQWCDPESMRWLAYLVRRSQRVPVVVAATRATGVAGPEVLDELCSLLGPVRLGSPPRQAVEALATELLGGVPDAGLIEGALRLTGGNAFLLTEYLAAGARQDGCPASVTRWAADWLRKAGTGAVRAARAVALLDGPADPPVIAEAAGMALDELAAVLRTLVELGFLAEDAPVRFTHPVLRQAVLADLPQNVRWLVRTGAGAAV